MRPKDKTVLKFYVRSIRIQNKKIPEAGDFINCENTPPLVDVDITAARVEQAAKKLSGGQAFQDLTLINCKEFF